MINLEFSPLPYDLSSRWDVKTQTYKLYPILYCFQHEFIENAKPVTILQKMILEAKEIQEEQTLNMNGNDSVSIPGFNFGCVG